MDFPPEILEQIFAHIPMMELLNIHSLVCKTWHQIISRPLFLPWKKSYFRYKLEAHLDEVTNVSFHAHLIFETNFCRIFCHFLINF